MKGNGFTNANIELTGAIMTQLVNVEEAARALGVSRTYIYRLSPNTFGVYRFGRAVRLSVEELREWACEEASNQPRDARPHVKTRKSERT